MSIVAASERRSVRPGPNNVGAGVPAPRVREMAAPQEG